MQLEKFFYVYMVADRSRVLYVGFTSDLYQRVLQHRKGRFQGFTSRYGCSRLVWFERFGGAQEAIAREKQIKRWRREKKVFLIEMENPTWEDLSAGWGLPLFWAEMIVAGGRKSNSKGAVRTGKGCGREAGFSAAQLTKA